MKIYLNIKICEDVKKYDNGVPHHIKSEISKVPQKNVTKISLE